MSQKEIWDKIAPSWNNFRQRPQPELKDLNWKSGKILDIGCGNCRNLLPFKNLDCYGIDFSSEMIKQAKIFTKKKNFKVKLKQSDMRKIPFKANFFNFILALATLHHLKDPEIAIKEISRVLKKDGEAYITIWNKLQPKFLLKKRETTIPWKQKDQTLNRYYNFIGFIKLRKLLKQNNFTIIKSNMLGKNITFLVKKLS